MHELAEGGADAYYEGRAATAIVDALASLGGRMSHADLAGHRSTFEPPISTTYRGHRVYECSPNGQGLTALIALKQKLAERGLATSRYRHVVLLRCRH